MKKTLIYSTILTFVLALTGCAKQAIIGPNDDAKRFIDAWVELYNKQNNRNIEPSGLGIYILEETPGDGDKTVTDKGYAIVEYTITDLDGNIIDYTSKETAQKLGTYNETSYYGPQVWLTMDATIQAGLQDALVNMKIGGKKKVMIPSWLMSYASYETEKEYLEQSSDYTHTIYEFTVQDFTDSIDVWQIDSIERYIVKEYGSLDAFSNDTTGFYYKRIQAPVSDKEFSTDTTIYINYTGKLLNGLIFDTNIERVAKDNGLYNASRTYEPTSIHWADSYGELTMSDSESSMITGFALTLWQMKTMEKGIGIFYSPLGYGYSGSGASIPAYTPLIFEIELVEEPED